ncbi:GerMN domain-containing protein [Actinomycetota bacterium]
MKNNIYRKELFKEAVMAVVICCLFFITFTISSCTPLETEPVQNNESEAENIQEDIVVEDPDVSEETAEEETGQEDVEEDPEEPEIGEITINIYYSDEMAEYLIAESRIIPSGNKFVDALFELMKIPIDDSLVTLVPDTTIINSVVVENGNAILDLSQDFLDDRFISDTVDILLLYSIVNTLTQFSEVNSVTLHIDGVKQDILGQLDIKDPVFRRNDLIKDDQG